MKNPFATDAFRILFRFGGLAALFFGVYIALCRPFMGQNAFALYGDKPAVVFAAMLIVGGLLQFVGCCRYSRRIAVCGAYLCLCVFLSAEFSCLKSGTSTGVPNYLMVSGFWSSFIYCIFRVPLPCSTSHAT